MPDDLEILAFATPEELWTWMGRQPVTHPGIWARLQKVGSAVASVDFHDLLEAGIAFGWSESSRRAYDATSYLQKFTPRRVPGTTSDRNRAIADRLQAEGRMTPAGRRAIGLQGRVRGTAVEDRAGSVRRPSHRSCVLVPMIG